MVLLGWVVSLVSERLGVERVHEVEAVCQAEVDLLLFVEGPKVFVRPELVPRALWPLAVELACESIRQSGRWAGRLPHGSVCCAPWLELVDSMMGT